MLAIQDSDEEELITDTHPPQDNFDSQNFQQLPDTEDEKVRAGSAVFAKLGI